MQVALTKAATRALDRLPGNVRATIEGRLARLAAEPQAFNVKALKGRSELRLHVGDWRILFFIEADRIVVVDVRPRGSAYR